MIKERVLYGWNFQRGFYLIAGLGMIIISILDQQWVGAAIGGYFAAMGVFGFGCAGGHCHAKPFDSPDESRPRQ